MREKVLIREVGPREGCQIHPHVIPTGEKVKLIEALFVTGVSHIEATSFVRADKVPQMADAETLLRSLSIPASVSVSALYLNEKGFEKSLQIPGIHTDGWVHTSVSETFLKRNSNRTHAEFLESLSSWKELFSKSRISFKGVMLSTSFGCAYEGKKTTVEMLTFLETIFQHFNKLNWFPEELCFADTNGFGDPTSVRDVVERATALYPTVKLSLHLHDTRGLAMANAYAGLQSGVRIFESSVGGIGGCPFTKGAAGNMPTEDFVYLCEALGLDTGINLDAYIDVAILAEKIFGKVLDGKIYRSRKA